MFQGRRTSVLMDFTPREKKSTLSILTGREKKNQHFNHYYKVDMNLTFF